jgi:stage V sporulation protein B
MISTVGFPLAVSKMVSEKIAHNQYKGARRVFNMSFAALGIIGGLSSIFLFLGADWLIDVSGWTEDSYYSIMAIALAPFFVAISSSFRGFFQGFQRMKPTAVSQIIEQVVRVIIGVALSYYLTVQFGVAYGVAGAVFGATIGGAVSALFLSVLYRLFRKQNQGLLTSGDEAEETKKLFKRLLLIVIPVTFTSAIVSFYSTLDSLMYMSGLTNIGIDQYTATSMFGEFSNAISIINIPLVISGTLSVALVPAISSSFAQKAKGAIKHQTEVAIKIIVLVALPICIGMAVLADGIYPLLYRSSDYGGSEMLRVLALGTILIMLSNVFQSILQSIDHFNIPLRNLAFATVVRVAGNYFLLQIPELNIMGLAISSILTYLLLAILNFYYLRKYTKVSVHIKQIIVKPMIAVAVMGLTTWGFYILVSGFIGSSIATILAIIVGSAVYTVVIIAVNGITDEELRYIPGKKVFIPVYKKIKSIRRKI